MALTLVKSPGSSMGSGPESPVRTRLSDGGRWIRTIGPPVTCRVGLSESCTVGPVWHSRSTRVSLSISRGSFLRRSSRAQPGDVCGFEQGADLRDPPILGSPQTGDGRITIVQLTGFDEFSGGAVGLAFEGIGGGEPSTNGALGEWGTTPQGIDGIFGPHTKASVEAFQAWGGVAADGIVGDQTWSVSLHAASATLESAVGLNFIID
jgi:hypothetical protein